MRLRHTPSSTLPKCKQFWKLMCSIWVSLRHSLSQVMRAGACIHAFCTCGIECLGQARGLRCYSAEPMLQRAFETSLLVMV